MTTNDPQTPLSGENALLNAIWHSLESVPLGAVTDALPAIVAELRDYGYRITKAQVEPDQALSRWSDDELIVNALYHHTSFVPEDMATKCREIASKIERRRRLNAAAAQPTDAGEGDG